MSSKPTDSELEILQILWELKSATVREVNEALSKNKDKEVGYTTTLKLMQIMHEKELVVRDVSSRTHIYKPLISQKDTQVNLVSKIIDTVFNGSPSQLVMQALNSKKSSPKEIELIRKYLEQMQKQ
ncbi:BlaI/MecI/CopY family transcriptional regulator [Arcticibacter sp.]|uniref:BlaI/MecI/CopY family transcriptional regulator n=1 Tax=Arcticibacter sp. TaxID=1872630 RepID=UPI003890B3A3